MNSLLKKERKKIFKNKQLNAIESNENPVWMQFKQTSKYLYNESWVKWPKKEKLNDPPLDNSKEKPFLPFLRRFFYFQVVKKKILVERGVCRKKNKGLYRTKMSREDKKISEFSPPHKLPKFIQEKLIWNLEEFPTTNLETHFSINMKNK